jgi:hypothetical protein
MWGQHRVGGDLGCVVDAGSLTALRKLVRASSRDLPSCSKGAEASVEGADAVSPEKWAWMRSPSAVKAAPT